MNPKLLTFLTTILLIPALGIAYNCPQVLVLKKKQPIEYNKADLIFTGEVTAIDQANRTFKILVTEAFKGTEKGTILTGKYDPVCGPRIDHQGKWLIYGHWDANQTLMVISCGLSRSFAKPEFGFYKIDLPDSLANTDYWSYHLRQAPTALSKELGLLREWSNSN